MNEETKKTELPGHRFCVAPMMDWTDRHCRAFHRVITRHALLYTEMITARAVRFGQRDRLLQFSAHEAPVALQLGGSDPAELALAARIGEEFGYAEINLNCGCPSDRVREGSFGACLMASPGLVAECVSAMKETVGLPVTVKCRIGINDQAEDEPLDRFVEYIKRAGCRTLIVHARKAWLDGLSPRDNRNVPPLNYARVYRLKRDHPEIAIIINGGIASLDDAEGHLRRVDGVMLGRAVYERPYVLAEVDRRFFAASAPQLSRQQILEAFRPYVEGELAAGTPLMQIARHMLGLYHGQYGGRLFRRLLSELGHRKAAGIEIIEEAVSAVERPSRLLAAE